MHMTSDALPEIIGGIIFLILGSSCFLYNRKVGGWLKRFPLAAFGLEAKVEVDEIIWRGLACLGGLFYIGMSLIFLSPLLR